MDIKIKSIKLENFKGAKEAYFEFDGKSVNGYGDNATGKTTVFDAFQWCLFDKNADGNSKFGIKPIDKKTGEEIHNLETMVELVLIVDTDIVVLKKVYKEKWVKKTGEVEKVFSGHTTDYFINDVPKQLKDYVSFVNGLVSEETFKMITNVYYFNSMDWKKARKVILGLSPDVSDDLVIASNKELEELRPLLKDKKIEDVLAIAKSDKTLASKQKDDIPARINELLKIDYSSVENTSVGILKQQIMDENKKLDEIKMKLASGSNEIEIANVRNQIKSLEIDKRELSIFKSDKQEKLNQLTTKANDLKREIASKELRVKELETTIVFNTRVIESTLKEKEELYAKYDDVAARVFHADNCSYCGQSLPSEKLEELEKEFNTQKVKELDIITNSGKRLNAQGEERQKELVEAQNELVNVKEVIDNLNKELDKVRADYKQLEFEVEVNPNHLKIMELENTIQTLKSKLNELELSDTLANYNEETSAIENKILDFNKKIVLIEEKEKTLKRIAELELEEKKANQNYLKAEKIINLCGKFTVAKVSLLEQSINSNFEIVKFKMFNQLVNGAIEETCIATVNGVPFGDLNHAMQINAGLDIIKSLQRVYGVVAPIFIDNAEAITKYHVNMNDTQFIKLYVSDKYPKIEFFEEGE